MKVYDEIALSNRNFEVWGSAKENADSLTNGQLATVEAILEDLYPEGISATQLNDIFRFDFDQIREWLGIEPEE